MESRLITHLLIHPGTTSQSSYLRLVSEWADWAPVASSPTNPLWPVVEPESHKTSSGASSSIYSWTNLQTLQKIFSVNSPPSTVFSEPMILMWVVSFLHHLWCIAPAYLQLICCVSNTGQSPLEHFKEILFVGGPHSTTAGTSECCTGLLMQDLELCGSVPSTLLPGSHR